MNDVHAVKIVKGRLPRMIGPDYQARCSCGWRSPWSMHETTAEAWSDDHRFGPSVEEVFKPSNTEPPF